MLRYYELLTDITPAALKALKGDLDQGRRHPRQVKEELALALVTRYHGREAAEYAAQEFARIFREHGLPEEIDMVILTKKGIVAIEVKSSFQVDSFALPHILLGAGTAESTSEARRLISQGAVKVNGEKITDVHRELAPGGPYILQVGKRRFKKVRLIGN
jgi:tyrosyl-tRNA synthetase